MDSPTAPTDFIPFDPAQAEAVDLLRGLHRTLMATAPPRPIGGLTDRLLGRLPARLGRGLAERWHPAPRPVTGLYLWGGVGRGKTHLMDWFVDALPLPGKRRVHFHHFMHEIHAAMAHMPKQPDPLEVLAEREAARTRVLCLDEFAVQNIADAMILSGLLRALFARGLTLVTTSNAQPRALYRNGLQRQRFVPAIELLERHTRVFELDGGTDYRRRVLTQGRAFFVAEGDGAEARLAACFEQVAVGPILAQSSYPVNGRQIPARRIAANAIWFDFATLCGGPRATADYIEIAREFPTVLLSGLPVLTQRHDAAARRLLHLVDELYDQRVQLIVSAAAPLEQLYDGGLHEFAHARLLSRLIEMQSADFSVAAPRAAR